MTVWDATTGAAIRSIASISSTPLEGMVLSPDGTVLATASSTEVMLWEYPSLRQRGEPIQSDPHVYFFNSIAFSHDGSQFATACGAELSVRTWETATGKLLFSRTHYPNERVMSVAFSPDDRTLVSTGADCARLWGLGVPNPGASPAGHTAILAGHTDWVWCAAFTDGKTLATASKDKTVKLWTIPPRRMIEIVESPDNGLLAVGYSTDGRFLYTIRHPGQCDLRDLESGALERTLPFAPASACVAAAFSSGCSLVAAVDAEGTISIGSPQESAPRIALDRAAAASPCLTYTKDGRMLAFVTRNGSIGRVDTTNPSGTIERLASPGSAPTCLAYASTADFLAGGVDGRLVVWDADTGRVRAISEFVTKEKITSVAISPDGSLCATDGMAGKILLWDRITLRALGMTGQDKNPITCLAFSQDGLTLISGQRSGVYASGTSRQRRFSPSKATRSAHGDRRDLYRSRRYRYFGDRRSGAAGTDQGCTLVHGPHQPRGGKLDPRMYRSAQPSHPSEFPRKFTPDGRRGFPITHLQIHSPGGFQTLTFESIHPGPVSSAQLRGLRSFRTHKAPGRRCRKVCV